MTLAELDALAKETTTLLPGATVETKPYPRAPNRDWLGIFRYGEAMNVVLVDQRMAATVGAADLRPYLFDALQALRGFVEVA